MEEDPISRIDAPRGVAIGVAIDVKRSG